MYCSRHLFSYVILLYAPFFMIVLFVLALKFLDPLQGLSPWPANIKRSVSSSSFCLVTACFSITKHIVVAVLSRQLWTVVGVRKHDFVIATSVRWYFLHCSLLQIFLDHIRLLKEVWIPWVTHSNSLHYQFIKRSESGPHTSNTVSLLQFSSLLGFLPPSFVNFFTFINILTVPTEVQKN